MSKLLEFYKKIHVQPDILNKLNSDEELEESVLEDLAQKYNQSRKDYFESTDLKEKISKAKNEAIQLYDIKVMKNMAKLVGMDIPNSKIKEYKSLDEFIPVVKSFQAEKETKLQNSSDEELKKELDKYKTVATQRAEEIETLENKFNNFTSEKEKEVQAEINLYKAKDYFHRVISNDKSIPDVPGKEFSISAIEDKIFNRYFMDGNGKILNKDGTKATHPDPTKEIAVESIEDVLPYFKNMAGLIQRNKSEEGGQVIVTKSGQTVSGYSDAAAKMAEKLNSAAGK